MPSPSLESSLVRILINDLEPRRPVGAGFLVTPKHVLTCAHVVNAALGRSLNVPDQPTPASEIFLDFPLLNNHSLLRAKILHWFPVTDNSATGTLDKLEDIAVLELSPETPLPAEAQPAPLVALDNAASIIDQRLRMCGFPGGVDQGTHIDGMLKGRTGAGYWEIHPLDKNRPIEQGFSGTAVWAVQENAVCGMISSRLRRKPDQENGPVITGYMLPASTLIRAFPKLDQHSRPANPYRGLEAFREKDANLYFGREQTITRLQQVVADQPFAAVIGASGSGKSSVVFAGLIPALRQTGDWLIAHCRPKKEPFYELSACLIPLLYDDPILRSEKTDELKEKLHAGSVGLLGIIRQIREQRKQQESQHFLLIVDQFEELFTLNTDQKLIRQYIGILLECLRTEDFTVLLTMRADFFAAAVSHPALAESLDSYAPIILPQLDEQGLREVVEQPANVLGVYFEPGLTDLIASDVGKEPGSLPLLEFCLTQLWERQEFRQISHDAYKAIGGVQQALANHADAVYAEFTEQEREQLRHIFLKLVRPGQGTEDTRQVANLEQIRAEDRALITRLADKRLIVTGRDEERGEETVEVVHEALIRRWRTLRQWTDERRNTMVLQKRIQTERCTAIDQIVSQLSQNLRNPIISIAATVDFLRRKNENPQLLKFLDLLSMEITSIEETIKDAFSFNDSAPLKQEQVALLPFTMNLITFFRKEMEIHKIDYQLNISEKIICKVDLRQMKQVLIHLLRNAIKAIGMEGRLNIEASSKNDQIRIYVRANRYSEIKIPYYVPPSYILDIGDTLVGRFVNNHNGEWSIHNPKNGGIEVEIILPR